VEGFLVILGLSVLVYIVLRIRFLQRRARERRIAAEELAALHFRNQLIHDALMMLDGPMGDHYRAQGILNRTASV